jgi:hypothetical protein
MTPHARYILPIIGSNLLFLLLLCIPALFVSSQNGVFGWMITAVILFWVSVLVQFFIGLFFILGKKKELGKAFLICSGIFFLIGLSVCSPMLFR